MRKIQQKQILDVLKTIDEAQVNGFYADCQDGAVAIGEFIEGIAGEGTQTVALLEEYCDLLYQACNGKISVKTLRRHIIKVENSVKSELKPTKIEAVFLPYKVSMWDSLESIYLAARADPACDAYVVPIPSYELNPNGTLGKMHYDGEQYPDDIPVINWQDYDIEARQPDIIFIHYAYDDYVTNATIHPIFYSDRLRQNCELLIYTPYYINMFGAAPDYNALLPGVLNSNYVMVESEAIRQSYIENYERYDKQYGWNGRFGKAEKKFLALGSPKFDKIIYSKPEDFTIPEEWAKLIANPDGTKKKTILFNTHMFIWLEGGEQYFKKLRFIFETFKNCNDVVLWWRPHPNTEINFRTKQPERLHEYLDVVNTYKNEDWGIYDDTPNLHRAIACTDAYYGDGSSLIPLYEATKKPVMLSNNYITRKDFNLPVFGALYTDEYIWFTVRYINALFKLRKSDNMLQLVDSFPDETASHQFDYPLYGEAAENNDMLYFAPFSAKEIAAYSTNDDSFHKISFKQEGLGENSESAFYSVVTYGKYVFFLPHSYPAIIRLNTDTGEISYFSDWVSPLTKLMSDAKSPFFWNHHLIAGSTIWLTAVTANAIMSFDMDGCTYKLHEIGPEGYRFSNTAFDGQHYWLSPQLNSQTPIIKWHPHSGIIRELSTIFDFIEPKHDVYLSYYCYKRILLIPFVGTNILEIDINTDEIRITDYEEYRGCSPNFYATEVKENLIHTYSLEKDSFIVINCETKEMHEKTIHYASDILEQLKPQLAQIVKRHSSITANATSKAFLENKTERLLDLIELVTQDEHTQNISNNNHNSTDIKVGNRIYDYLSKLLN